MQISLTVAVVLLLGWTAVTSANAHSAALDATYDCVVASAQEQGYPYPYSQDAWTLFAPGCTK